MTEDRLEPYRAKRAFDVTPEPSGAGTEAEATPEASVAAGAGGPRFVVQKHDARRLHYDVRLEADGVLISWAVPKGPSYDPKVKRLAVHVEDHPLDYRGFEGVIPDAQYGAGTVIVWDEGTYRNLTERRGTPVGVADAVRSGHVSVWLEGTKLRGGWSLTRTGGGGGRGGTKESWIMVKRADERADPGLDITESAPNSVRSGRSLGEIGADSASPEWTAERATWVPPMLAKLDPRAKGRRWEPGEWQVERKFDGLRCVAVRNGARVELWSRNHLPFTGRFPEVVESLAALDADTFCIDGEIVAFDGTRTSFGMLQRPGGTSTAVYCAFDLLQLLGRDTTALPLGDRQALLARLVDRRTGSLTVVEALDGDPAALLDRACEEGWEGLIAKRVGSPYRSGRSGDWLKLKCSAGQELVIGGWTDPTGARSGFGALLVGYYDRDGQLHYAGKVGTGFDEQTLRDLHRRLLGLAADASPFAEAVKVKGSHWVRPDLIGEVAFTEWTSDGRLRHPSFRGLRPDKDPREVRRELPPEPTGNPPV